MIYLGKIREMLAIASISRHNGKYEKTRALWKWLNEKCNYSNIKANPDSTSYHGKQPK